MHGHTRAILLFSTLLSTAAGPAFAYEVKHSDTGEPLRWGEAPLEIDLTLEESPVDVDGTSAAEAVRAAFETWGEYLPEELALGVDSLEGASATPSPSDERNIVRWIEEDWEESYESEALAVTLTTYDPDTGRITDADIMINAAKYKWVADQAALEGCSASYDLQNVMTHEIGHLLGLAHDTDFPEATMYPTSAFCETKKRDLDSDDSAGLSYLYVELGPVPMDEAGGFGCSMASRSGSAGPGAPTLLLLAGIVLVRRRRA